MFRELLEFSAIYRFYRDLDPTSKQIMKVLFLALFIMLVLSRLWLEGEL